MKANHKLNLADCPRCQKPLESNWYVCPQCGLRIKPGDDLALRAFGWLLVITAFAVTIGLLTKGDPGTAAGFAMVFGIPLAFVFGKAVIFRIQGRPLSFDRLRSSAIGAFLWLVVVPIAVGISLLVLACAACFAYFAVYPINFH